MILKKLLFTTFCVTSGCFSSIRSVVISSTTRLINCFSSVLFTTSFATQQVHETFDVTVKVMIDFICRFSEKTRKKYPVLEYLYTLETSGSHI